MSLRSAPRPGANRNDWDSVALRRHPRGEGRVTNLPTTVGPTKVDHPAMPSRRQLAVVGLPLVALAAAGCALLAVGGPDWATVAGLTLVGVAGVGAVSAVFYAVGL